MRERQPRIRPREGGVELQRGLETVARLQVVVAVEAVHVPQAAVMCLPRVERAGRLQDRAVALGEFDLAGDRRDDAVADLVEHGKRVVVPRADGVGPDDARAARLAQLHADGGAARAALQRAAGHVVDVERAARLLGADVPLVEGETPVPIVRTALSDADVAYAIDAECAVSICDVLERRARSNLFAPGNGLPDVERVGALLAARLGWDDRRLATEIEHYRARIADDVAWRASRS